MHGELVADERRENLMLFAKGHCDVLVATAAFGRGLDLEIVKHVINFDFPYLRRNLQLKLGILSHDLSNNML